MVNDLPAMQETWVRSLGWEDPLEKEMATHSSVLDDARGKREQVAVPHHGEVLWPLEQGKATHSSVLAWRESQRVGHD